MHTKARCILGLVTVLVLSGCRILQPNIVEAGFRDPVIVEQLDAIRVEPRRIDIHGFVGDETMRDHSQVIIDQLVRNANVEAPESPVAIVDAVLRQDRYVREYRERFAVTVELSVYLDEDSATPAATMIRTIDTDTPARSYRFLYRQYEHAFGALFGRRVR